MKKERRKGFVNRKNKLSFATRLGYGMGDIYGGGSTTLINMYYLYFLVDVVGLSPTLAGTAFLISKIWDAVTDPFMGLISDNTRTRFGRRRPYFLAGIGLIFITFALMWMPPHFSRQWADFAWCLGAYILYSTVYTMVWVPYNSIASELTSDYDERTKLAFFRMICSNLAGILAATLPKDLFENVLFRGDSGRAYTAVGIAYGLFFALPYLVTFFTCRENPEFMALPRKRIGSLKEFVVENFVRPFENRPFRFVVFMYLFGFMAQDAVLGMAVYFLTYALGIDSMMTLLVPVYGGLLLSLALASKLGRLIGKRKTFLLGGVMWLAALALVLMMHPGMPMAIMYVFGIAFGMGLAGVQSMVFAIFPDIPDADELMSGTRREGLYSGIFALLRKGGSAFILFLIGFLIELSGYLPPVEGVKQIQSEAFVRNLTIVFVGLPAICIAMALFAAYRYPLTRERLTRIREMNEVRRRGEKLNPEQGEWEKELLPLMGGKKREA